MRKREPTVHQEAPMFSRADGLRPAPEARHALCVGNAEADHVQAVRTQGGTVIIEATVTVTPGSVEDVFLHEHFVAQRAVEPTVFTRIPGAEGIRNPLRITRRVHQIQPGADLVRYTMIARL